MSGNRSDSSPPLLILDTDVSSDVDDVGAIALLHSLANKGRVQILAMMISSGDPMSVSCVDAINTWFGRPDIPIGRVTGKSVQDSSKYTKIIADEFVHNSSPAGETQNAVQLYRELLSAQPDHSVTVVTIGYLTNLHHLLLSQPDTFSPLDGTALVSQKVERLVCMGGAYPAGREWNFSRDRAATAYVVDHWPTPIVFSGFEIGKDILTGAGLQKSWQPNPVRRSYELYNGLTDRPSWDQVAVYYAVATAGGRKTSLWSRVFGRNTVQSDGSNQWRYDQEGQPEHTFLVQHGSTAMITALFEQLMLSTPQ